MKPEGILHFWFNEIEPQQQFENDPEFDQLIRDRFLATHKKVSAGETKDWRSTPGGRLAEIIVLDQFSRNMFRNTSEAFASDTMALTLAKEAVARADDVRWPAPQRSFFYMPFMHSENKVDHEIALKLFSQPSLENGLKFEIAHKIIIDRFGRYPHRNKALGRESNAAEIEFLKGKLSSF